MSRPCLVAMMMVEFVSTLASIILLMNESFAVSSVVMAAVAASHTNTCVVNATPAFSMALFFARVVLRQGCVLAGVGFIFTAAATVSFDAE